jgi:hypothetical protein
VLECEGVHVFAGLHDDTLLQVDGVQFVGDVLVELGVAVPVPDATLTDAAFIAKLARRWHSLAETLYADGAEGAEDDDDGDDR